MYSIISLEFLAFCVASKVWSFFFFHLNKMICVNREILLLNHSSFSPFSFWRKVILVWGVCRCLTVLSFPYFCLKTLDFGRYWENSPTGWRSLTLQPGRTSETGRRHLINRIIFKNAKVVWTFWIYGNEDMIYRKTLLNSKITFIELLPSPLLSILMGQLDLCLCFFFFL